MTHQSLPYTQAQLAAGFKELGVAPGQVLMVHASVKSVGSMMGGPEVILRALFDTVTPSGTVMMYAGWQDIPDFLSDLPEESQQLYREHHPAFDPRIARSVRGNGILVEFLRTWPGAHRSANPEASMVAVGADAAWLTRDHPLNYGYGPGSPLAKLVQRRGYVLLLGAPLTTITLLHYAENRAKMRRKNVTQYQCPILQAGERVWVDIEDYNTGVEHDDYTLDAIARAYLAQHETRCGRVGNAEAFLFDAAELTSFAIRWLEANFGQ